jgi:hypothetical protein
VVRLVVWLVVLGLVVLCCCYFIYCCGFHVGNIGLFSVVAPSSAFSPLGAGRGF